jgi:hypothetical protein
MISSPLIVVSFYQFSIVMPIAIAALFGWGSTPALQTGGLQPFLDFYKAIGVPEK